MRVSVPERKYILLLVLGQRHCGDEEGIGWVHGLQSKGEGRGVQLRALGLWWGSTAVSAQLPLPRPRRPFRKLSASCHSSTTYPGFSAIPHFTPSSQQLPMIACLFLMSL